MLLIYLLSGGTALLILHAEGVRTWYWHVISVLAGLVIGLFPPPSGASGNLYYLLMGSGFMFLFTWGAAAILFSGFVSGSQGNGRSRIPAH